MSGLRHCLLCFCILGYNFFSSRAWQVKMPSHIKGLLGSCLVIPCKFNYQRYPPERPDRVVWYQYVDRGYPLVYDKWNPDDVIAKYKWRTHAFTSAYSKTCSLKIEPVMLYDHSQKLYPWVDPENVGRGTYRFWDTTVTIEVVDRAEAPDITIFGRLKVGQTVTVQCSVYHTCSTNPPTLSFNIPLKNHQLRHTEHDATTKTTLTTTLFTERDYQTVTCSVRHPGGRTARASKTLSAECSISPLTIRPMSDEFLERYASKVICTATYTCSKHIPTITWNYGGMPVSTDTTKVPGAALWRTVSTLTFTSSANSHGESLVCYARFTGGLIQFVSLTLRVKRNMLSRGWSFTTPGSVTGLRGSCIIIPCRFTYSTSQPSDLQVIWYLYQSNGYPAVYSQRGNDVISEFRGKTSLMGSVSDRNCSLKIERLEMSHNEDRLYPWIDKNPITSYHTTGHSFYDKTTQLIVSDRAQEPQLSIIGIPRVGEQSRVSCSVRHTCLSAPPTLILSGIPGTDQTVDTLVSDGMWERTVARTWTVEEEHQCQVQCDLPRWSESLK
uniref:Si:dkey-238d18.10 n=1 Tax=Amphiprion percula TaxID=161767 RepID=A0A3P8TBR8_AMPPE